MKETMPMDIKFPLCHHFFANNKVTVGRDTQAFISNLKFAQMTFYELQGRACRQW
jgi:hypothetical protein